MTSSDDPGVQVIGGMVLIGPRACAALGPHLQLLIRTKNLDPTSQLAASLIASVGRGFIGSTAVKNDADEIESRHEGITTIRAAQLLGCKVRNVCDLAKRGRLHGRKCGRQWVFLLQDVLEYRANRKV